MPCLRLLLRASITRSNVERRRVLDATITGLNTIGLAVVAIRSLSPEQTVYRVANTLSTALVVPVQVPGNWTITLITSRNEPVGALVAGAMQTMAGPLQE